MSDKPEIERRVQFYLDAVQKELEAVRELIKAKAACEVADKAHANAKRRVSETYSAALKP